MKPTSQFLTPAPVTAAASRLAGALDSQTMITVGIVEDNRELRSSLQRMVDAAPGHRCVCACDSAEDAFRVVPAARPQVLLMDIHLPFRSGIECTRRLCDSYHFSQSIGTMRQSVAFA